METRPHLLFVLTKRSSISVCVRSLLSSLLAVFLGAQVMPVGPISLDTMSAEVGSFFQNQRAVFAGTTTTVACIFCCFSTIWS